MAGARAVLATAMIAVLAAVGVVTSAAPAGAAGGAGNDRTNSVDGEADQVSGNAGTDTCTRDIGIHTGVARTAEVSSPPGQRRYPLIGRDARGDCRTSRAGCPSRAIRGS
jgi:hypothetical protein